MYTNGMVITSNLSFTISEIEQQTVKEGNHSETTVNRLACILIKLHNSTLLRI
jgi:hypothetical protein